MAITWTFGLVSVSTSELQWVVPAPLLRTGRMSLQIEELSPCHPSDRNCPSSIECSRAVALCAARELSADFIPLWPPQLYLFGVFFLHSVCLQGLNNFLSIWFLAKKLWVLCILLCLLLSPDLFFLFLFLFPIYFSSQQAFLCWLICLQQIFYHCLQHLPLLVLIFCCNCLRKPFKIHLAEGWEIISHFVGKSCIF